MCFYISEKPSFQSKPHKYSEFYLHYTHFLLTYPADFCLNMVIQKLIWNFFNYFLKNSCLFLDFYVE